MIQTTILLVDDHALLRKGLCALIEKKEDLKVIGEAGDGRQAVDLVRQLKPDVVVMDINMPKLDGIEATRQILSDSPETKVLALSIHSGKRYVEEMLKAGAAGYLLKESAPEELIAAIRALQAGKGYLSADITDIVLSRLRQKPQEREAKASRPDARYLAGKLYKPELPLGIVHRRKLVERLERDREKKLILVIAPAGYGKSTLICDWLEHYGRQNVWLAFDENYNDTGLFLRYLLAAISDVVPEFGSTIKPLLSSATIPSPDILAEAMVADFATIATPLVLALDDYHRITSKTVQEMVIQMLQNLPDGIQFVILSRHDPPWPLSRWRVSGWMRDLRAFDLRFSLEEVGIFFKDFHFDSRTLANLQNLTEGWVTGLQLVKLSLVDEKNPEHFVRTFSSNDRLIVDYLMEEVVTRQPPDMLDFLSVSAMFDRFCASLCDALLADGNAGRMGGQAYIDRLEKENLFLVPLDRDRLWFRYHHLFQNLLQQHLRQNLSVERKTLLRHRAGKWFAKQGLPTEALHQFLAVGEVGEAAELVEEQVHTLLDESSEVRILDKWLPLFPDSSMRILPSLMAVKAIRNVYTYNLVEALSLAERAKELLQAPSCSISEPRRQSLLGDIEAIFAFCLYWQGDVESALLHAELAVQLVPEEHKTIHGLAITYSVLSLALLGRQKEALKLLFDALAKDHATGSHMAGQLLACRAVIHTYTGNLSVIRKSARQMLSIHEGAPMPDYWRGYAQYFLGSAAYESNFLDEAEVLFRSNIKLRDQMDPRVYHDSLLALARIALWKGERAVVEEFVSSARMFAVKINDPYLIEYSNLFEGRLRGMSVIASSHREMQVPNFNQYSIEPPSLVLAENLIDNGSPEDLAVGVEILEQALHQARRFHNARQVVQLLAVKAVAEKWAGNPDGSLQVLEESLHMAKARGFVRTFLDRGQEMAGMLNKLLAKDQENSYIRRLVEAFSATRPGAETVASSFLSEKQQEELLPCPLSNREFEVLQLLEKRLSNKEIAERLYLSPETVKKHASNIFSKLNANNRRQAVEIARRCSLISPR